MTIPTKRSTARPQSASKRQTHQQPVQNGASSNGHRVFAREGEPVTFGGQQLHIGVLTTYGIIQLQQRLGSYDISPFASGKSLGGLIVNSAIVTNKWQPFYELMDFVLTEPFPRGGELDADPEELQHVLDVTLEHAGLGWMEKMLGNFQAAAARKAAETVEAQLAPLLERLVLALPPLTETETGTGQEQGPTLSALPLPAPTTPDGSSVTSSASSSP